MNKKAKHGKINWLFLAAWLMLVFFCISGNNVSGQQHQNTTHISGPGGHNFQLNGGRAVFLSNGDSIISHVLHDPNQEVKIIVQFGSPPLAVIRGKNGNAFPGLEEVSLARIRGEHSRFLSDLATMQSSAMNDEKLLADDTRLGYAYEVVFNGMALTTRQWLADQIMELPDVKSVHRDVKVFASLDQSVPVIGADQIWTEHNITGEGIVVGILDTGIDYLHPDLGGGMGPGFKVLGGYDFVNDDNDPMDDHSHGTHVAGIVAANGVLQGVAPGANLKGYKVLGADGSGYSSWIIAGIEQSVIDGVHVLNASLGGPGSPYDPMAQAIDNASLAGVICVVAAGNDGSSYFTVGSPGVAKRAITVGATWVDDNIAWFSSRGPVKDTYGVKPDVLAPGVMTNSTMPNGAYAQLSGTSMASPHVAGAVSLFLNKYPGHTPDQVKSIFMQSAVNLDYDVWTQGTGRIDLMQAFELPPIVVQPGILGLGIVDISTDFWTSSDTLFVSNLQNEQQTVNLSVNGTLPPGVNLSITPSIFDLPPQSTFPVVVTLEVNNNLLPFPQSQPPSYTISLAMNTANYQTNVPLVFVKTPILHLSLDEEPEWVLAVGQGGITSGFVQYQGTEIYIPLPPGTFDVIVQYKDILTTLIFEELILNDVVHITASKEDAKNHVHIHALNTEGQPVITKTSMELIMLPLSGWFIAFFGEQLAFDRYFNDFSNSDWHSGGITGNDTKDLFYIIGGNITECLDDITLTYNLEELVSLQLAFDNPVAEAGLFPMGSLNMENWGSGFYNLNDQPLSYPHAMEVRISPHFKKETIEMSFFFNLFEYGSPPFDYCGIYCGLIPEYTTPRIFLNEDVQPTLLSYDHLPPGFRVESKIPAKGSFINMDLGPAAWNGIIFHQPGDQIIVGNLSNLFQLQKKGLFYPGKLVYSLFRNGDLVEGGDFYENNPVFDSWLGGWNLEPGDYVIEMVTEQYWIQQQQGLATARSGFNTSAEYGFVPRLASFNIFFSEAYYTDLVGTGIEGVIDFVIVMEEAYKEGSVVTLEYKVDGETDWTPLDLEKTQNRFTTNIPDTLPLGYVSLRITATDFSGSYLEYTAEPAFLRADVLPATLAIKQAKTDIYQNTATLKSEVTNDGGGPVIAKGVVWGVAPDPSLENNGGFTNDGNGLGVFNSQISGLLPQTIYYVRAYATNSQGNSYSEQWVLDEIPLCLPPHELFATNITQNTATIGWTEPGNATLWDVVYGVKDFDPDQEGILLAAVSNPIEIEGLEHSTPHEVYVRSHCIEETSGWSAPLLFLSDCGPVSITFFRPSENEIFDIAQSPLIPYSIQYQGCGAIGAGLYLSQNGNNTWIGVIYLNEAGFYDLVFEAPTTVASGHYRFAIEVYTDNQSQYFYSEEFEIINDFITIDVVSPEASNYFVTGQPGLIRWNSVNVSNVNIFYSIDNGLQWHTAATNIGSPNGYQPWGNNLYFWGIPASLTGTHPQSLVRIESTDNSEVYAESEAFTISDILPLEILAPHAESQVETMGLLQAELQIHHASSIYFYLVDQQGSYHYLGGYYLETGLQQQSLQIGNFPVNQEYYLLVSHYGSNMDFISESFTIVKAMPQIIWPQASAINYGQALSATQLSGGSAVHNQQAVAGSFVLEEPDFFPPAGIFQAAVRFIPENAGVYNEVTGVIEVLVNSSMLSLEGSFTVMDKYADGTTAATIVENNLTLSGILENDEVYLGSVEAAFAQSLPGQDISVYIVSATLTGPDQGNYQVSLEGAPESAASILQIFYDIVLSSEPPEGGSTSGGGSFGGGTLVTAQALPAESYQFTSWKENGESVSMEAHYSFTAISDRNLTAHFLFTPLHTITLEASPAAWGVVTGGGQYFEGTVISVEAAPNYGYAFSHWTESGQFVSASQLYTFEVMAPRTLTAVFMQQSFSITAELQPAGTGIVSGTGSFPYLTNQTLQATANQGYLFAGWSENGQPAGSQQLLSVIVNGHRHFVAYFVTATYAVSFTVSDVQEQPIDDAVIAFGGQSANPGAYYFAGLLPGHYSWEISREGYFTESGQTHLVETDLDIQVTLQVDDTQAGDLSIPTLKIYPNPASNFVIIEGALVQKAELLQMHGVLVKTFHNPAGTLNLEGITPGYYFLRLFINDQIVVHRLMVR